MNPSLTHSPRSASLPPPPAEGRGEGTPRGFTLVELLVVIAIIGTITAIAVPTIFSAIASARNAKTKSELDLLHMAIMNYKNEYGSFPPANMVGLWNASAGTVNTRHPVYKHLVRIFPRLSEDRAGADSPYLAMAQMSPAQALVFWLQGFYENPEFPLTNGPTRPPGNRKKLFEFDESRLYAASAYSLGTAQTFATRSSAATAAMSPFAVYFTGQPTCGLPYVYFDSRCYDDNAAADLGYIALSTNGNQSVAFPYINSAPPLNPTWAQQHMASDTFQIIAGGRDDLYGLVQAAFPTAWNAYPPASNTSTAVGHADNITNFADRPLADAIEAMNPQ